MTPITEGETIVVEDKKESGEGEGDGADDKTEKMDVDIDGADAAARDVTDDDFKPEAETNASETTTPSASPAVSKKRTSSGKTKTKTPKTPAVPVELSEAAKCNIATCVKREEELLSGLLNYETKSPQLFDLDHGVDGAIADIIALCKPIAPIEVKKVQKDEEKKEKDDDKVNTDNTANSASTSVTTDNIVVEKPTEEVASPAKSETAEPSTTVESITTTTSTTEESTTAMEIAEPEAEQPEEEKMIMIVDKGINAIIARSVQGKKDTRDDVLFYVDQSLQKTQDDLPKEDVVYSSECGFSEVAVIEANKRRAMISSCLSTLLDDENSGHIQEALTRVVEREALGYKAKDVSMYDDKSESAIWRWTVIGNTIPTYFEKSIGNLVREAKGILRIHGLAIKACHRMIEQCKKHPYDDAKVSKCEERRDKAITDIAKSELKRVEIEKKALTRREEAEKKKKALSQEKSKKDSELAVKKAERAEAARIKAEEKEKEKAAKALEREQAKAAKEQEKLEKQKEKDAIEAAKQTELN